MFKCINLGAPPDIVLIELQWIVDLCFDKQPFLPKKFEAGRSPDTLEKHGFKTNAKLSPMDSCECLQLCISYKECLAQ